MKSVHDNIKKESRHATTLVLWLDCDREGEAIAQEVRSICVTNNNPIGVYRAHFSDTLKSSLVYALNHLGSIDMNAVQAVEARQELDFRVGCAFTRWQMKTLQRFVINNAGSPIKKDSVVSYGPCQFPTLGFVVARYRQRQSFRPEQTWTVSVAMDAENGRSKLPQKSGPLFSQPLALAIRALARRGLRVSEASEKTETIAAPAPPNTLDMQRGVGHGMSGQAVMKAAEDLYTRGFISYPRTETRSLPSETARKSVQALAQGCGAPGGVAEMARALLNNMYGGYRDPRSGSGDDRAHPAIHPLRCPTDGELRGEHLLVYNWVARRFLACCAGAAVANRRTVELTTATDTPLGGVAFRSTATQVVERNWLDLVGAPPDAHCQGGVLPATGEGGLRVGDAIPPGSFSVDITNGSTRAPALISEAELLGLMDECGIGTDATAAQHIDTIVSRGYVQRIHKREKNETVQLTPTPLGLALADAYASLGEDGSQLVLPELRAQTELDMRQVAEGALDAALMKSRTINAVMGLFQIANMDQGEHWANLVRRSLAR